MPDTDRQRPSLSTTTATTGTLVDRRKKLPFVLVERIILRSRQLSNNAKLLYLFLADYAGDEGSCFPGQPRLATDLQMNSIDTVARALKELRTARLIDWKQQGLNRPNVYSLLPVEESVLKSAIPAMLQSPVSPTPPKPRIGARPRLESAPMRSPDSAPMRVQESAPTRTKQDSGEQDSGKQQHLRVDKESKGKDVVVANLIKRQCSVSQNSEGTPKSQPAAVQAPAPVAELDVLGLASLTNGLVERGVALPVAQKWLRQSTSEYVQQLLEYHDWCQKQRPGFIKDSGAWLSTALASAIVFPDSYLKAKAGGRQQAEEDARAAEEQARLEAEEVRRRATELAQDPGDWARRRLQTYEDSQKLLGRPPLTEAQRREREAQYTTSWSRQRATFIAEHPEFADLLGGAPGTPADVAPAPDEALEATTQTQLKAWRQERHAAQEEQSLQSEAVRLARSPEERAEDALRGLDENADALGEPRLSSGARAERRRVLVAQFRAEQGSEQGSGEASPAPSWKVPEGRFHGPDERQRPNEHPAPKNALSKSLRASPTALQIAE